MVLRGLSGGRSVLYLVVVQKAKELTVLGRPVVMRPVDLDILAPLLGILRRLAVLVSLVTVVVVRLWEAEGGRHHPQQSRAMHPIWLERLANLPTGIVANAIRE